MLPHTSHQPPHFFSKSLFLFSLTLFILFKVPAFFVSDVKGIQSIYAIKSLNFSNILVISKLFMLFFVFESLLSNKFRIDLKSILQIIKNINFNILSNTINTIIIKETRDKIPARKKTLLKNNKEMLK